MSFDIVAFDPGAVTDDGFAEWFDAQTEWTEDHSYDDPAVTTPQLRAFVRELGGTFPPMNGPDATGDPDDPRVTDYAIGSRIVYAGFAWSQQQEAQQLFVELATKHGVAVALVSSDSRILRP